MEKQTTDKVLKFIALITFLIMVIVNALANILPINNIDTGAVSDSYPNLFAPAGITFAIWGVIYLLLSLYTLYQIGLLRKKEQAVNQDLLNKVNLLFSISSLTNAAWIFTWHYRLIPVSMLLMIIILLCLILINQTLNDEKFSALETLFVKVPFSVYFGWITVATIANATTLLVDLGWNRFGLSEALWTILILVIGALITGVTTIKAKNIFYGLVPVWAYSGILYKHVSDIGFSGKYPMVIVAVSICLGLLLAALVKVIFVKKGNDSLPEMTDLA